MRLVAIMPTFNQREFIEAAVESVREQVDLLIIVDDGSTDGTREWLSGLDYDNVQVLEHEQNQGTATAINTGFAQVPENAEWVTWISSDNTYESNWAEILLGFVQDDIGVVYSAFWFERPGGERKKLFNCHISGKLLHQVDCYYGPSFIIRRDVWVKAGNHRGKISHDYDHWLRVEEACWEMGLEIEECDVPLCHYNAHDKRVTKTRADQFDAPEWQAEARRRRGA